MSSQSEAVKGERTAERTSDFNVALIVGSLILGVFLGGFGGGVAFPTLPTLGGVLGISPFLVGVILSLNRVTRLIVNTPAGKIIDTLGTREPMIVGFFLQGVAPFGYVLGLYPGLVPGVGSTVIFSAARILWGFGSAFVFVGAFSTVTHITTKHNRGTWIGYFRGGQSLGFPMGMIAGGLLTDMYGYEVAFTASGVSGLVAAVVAVGVLPNVSPSIGQSTGILDVLKSARADSRIFMIGTVNFTIRFIYSGILLSTIVLYAEVHSIRISEFSAVGASGIIMAVSVIFSSVTTLVSGTLSDKIDNRAFISLPALGLFGSGFALLGLRPTLFATILGIAAIGIGVGGSNPPLLAYLGDISSSADVGKMGGLYNVFGDLGSALGPLLALPLAAVIGYRTIYFICTLLALFVGVLAYRSLIVATAST